MSSDQLGREELALLLSKCGLLLGSINLLQCMIAADKVKPAFAGKTEEDLKVAASLFRRIMHEAADATDALMLAAMAFHPVEKEPTHKEPGTPQ